jgi:hypothetical protein
MAAMLLEFGVGWHASDKRLYEQTDYINKHYPQANIKDSADCLTLRMMSIDETAEDSDGDTIASSVAQFNTVSSSHNDYERTETDDQYKAIVESLIFFVVMILAFL